MCLTPLCYAKQSFAMGESTAFKLRERIPQVNYLSFLKTFLFFYLSTSAIQILPELHSSLSLKWAAIPPTNFHCIWSPLFVLRTQGKRHEVFPWGQLLLVTIESIYGCRPVFNIRLGVAEAPMCFLNKLICAFVICKVLKSIGSRIEASPAQL